MKVGIFNMEVPDTIYPSKDDWHILEMARIFCPEKTWKACPHKDICVDGNERVWVECPTVIEHDRMFATTH